MVLLGWLMKNVICFFIFFIFSFYAFGIEINSDLFIEGNTDEEEIVETGDIEGGDFDLAGPRIEKVYKKRKVIIKRDLSSLTDAVKELPKEESGMNASLRKGVSERRGLAAEEESADYEEESANSVDYGDYEIHWSRRN